MGKSGGGRAHAHTGVAVAAGGPARMAGTGVAAHAPRMRQGNGRERSARSGDAAPRGLRRREARGHDREEASRAVGKGDDGCLS